MILSSFHPPPPSIILACADVIAIHSNFTYMHVDAVVILLQERALIDSSIMLVLVCSVID